MSVDPKTNGLSEKKVVITNLVKGAWSLTFEGLITNRDIKKLQRLLLIEFTKVQRRRSVAAVMKQQSLVQASQSKEPVDAPGTERSSEAKAPAVYNPARR